jgi:hypothetical protein
VNACGKQEINAKFWPGSLKRRDHFEDLSVKIQTGFSWLRIDSDEMLL